MSRTYARPDPLTFFAACDQTRSLWHQLNELRGRSSTGSWIDCDIGMLAEILGELRDCIAMHYAHEWCGAGHLRQAVLDQAITNHQASSFLNEQVHIYQLISQLADDVESIHYTMDVAPRALRIACDRFKMFDALLISNESRKTLALRA